MASTDIDVGKCAQNIHREPVQGDHRRSPDSAQNIVRGGGAAARTVNVVMQVAALDVMTGPDNIMDAYHKVSWLRGDVSQSNVAVWAVLILRKSKTRKIRDCCCGK